MKSSIVKATLEPKKILVSQKAKETQLSNSPMQHFPLRSSGAIETFQKHQKSIDKDHIMASFRKSFVETLKNRLIHKILDRKKEAAEKIPQLENIYNTKSSPSPILFKSSVIHESVIFNFPDELAIVFAFSNELLKYKPQLTDEKVAHNLGVELANQAYMIILSINYFTDKNLKKLIFEKIIERKILENFFANKIPYLISPIGDVLLDPNNLKTSHGQTLELSSNTAPTVTATPVEIGSPAEEISIVGAPSIAPSIAPYKNKWFCCFG